MSETKVTPTEVGWKLLLKLLTVSIQKMESEVGVRARLHISKALGHAQRLGQCMRECEGGEWPYLPAFSRHDTGVIAEKMLDVMEHFGRRPEIDSAIHKLAEELKCTSQLGWSVRQRAHENEEGERDVEK